MKDYRMKLKTYQGNVESVSFIVDLIQDLSLVYQYLQNQMKL